MLAFSGLILFSGCASTITADFSEIANDLGYQCVNTRPSDGVETLLSCQNPNFEHLEFTMYETHSGQINALEGVNREWTSSTDVNGNWIVAGENEDDVDDASEKLQR